MAEKIDDAEMLKFLDALIEIDPVADAEAVEAMVDVEDVEMFETGEVEDAE